MRLCDKSFASLELFLTLLPLFINALPPHPEITLSSSQPKLSSRVEEFKNATTLLRFEIQEMQNVLTKDRAEYDLSAEEADKATHALEDVLLLLEGLVHSSVLECHGICLPLGSCFRQPHF